MISNTPVTFAIAVSFDTNRAEVVLQTPSGHVAPTGITAEGSGPDDAIKKALEALAAAIGSK